MNHVPSQSPPWAPSSVHAVPSFEETYRLFGDRTLNLLYRFVNDENQAKDLLQDVFVKVFEALPTFEQRSDLATWIHRIAVNHALNYLKRERRTLWFNVLDESVGALLEKGAIDLHSWGSGAIDRPDHQLESREQEALVERVVHELPIRYRMPYLLHRDGAMSNPEIARELGLGLSAVETRIHRAKKMLVARLKPLLLDSG